MKKNTISQDIFDNTNMNKARLYIKRCYNNNPKLLFYYLALSYCKEGDYEEGIKHFNSALYAGLCNYLIYYNLGVLYLERSEFIKSEIYFKKSIDLNKSFDKSYINLAHIYYNTGDIKRAYRTIKTGSIYSENPDLAVIEKKLFDIIQHLKS